MRHKGSKNRPKEDSVKVLQQWLKQAKRLMAETIGCASCIQLRPGTWDQPKDPEKDPHKLMWKKPEGYGASPVTQWPSLPGMTRQKLEELLGPCELICVSCAGKMSMTSYTKQDRDHKKRSQMSQAERKFWDQEVEEEEWREEYRKTHGKDPDYENCLRDCAARGERPPLPGPKIAHLYVGDPRITGGI